jgi:hypothetical protein
MKDPKWDEVLAVAIKPAGEDLLSQYSDLKWADDPSQSWASKVRTIYDNIRAYMRSRMKLPAEGERILDRHKVAAALARAIVEAKPLVPKDKNFLSEGAFYANEALALESALSIIVSFGLDDAHGSKAYKGYDLSWIFSQPFVFPACNEKPYRQHLHTAMKHAVCRRKEDSFDEFLFANVLFLLEHHHVQSCQQMAEPAAA